MLREGWALGSVGVAANLLLTYLVLLAALRFVGVACATELSAAEAFAAFAIAFWAGAGFPITGSGLGVVDAVLIAMLIELGIASDDALLAAALLWRVFYSVIILPLGAITLSRMRKVNPDVLQRGAGGASPTLNGARPLESTGSPPVQSSAHRPARRAGSAAKAMPTGDCAPVLRQSPQPFSVVVELDPHGLLVVLLPVGAWHRDRPTRPCPGRPSTRGPDLGTNDRARCELHG